MPKFLAEHIHATGAPVACYRNRTAIIKDVREQARACSRKSSQFHNTKQALTRIAKKHKDTPTFACFVDSKLAGVFTRLPDQIFWQDFYPNSGRFGNAQRIANRTHGLSSGDVLELVCADSGNVTVRRIA